MPDQPTDRFLPRRLKAAYDEAKSSGSGPGVPRVELRPTCPNIFGGDIHDFINVAQCGSHEGHPGHSWGDAYGGGGHCCGWPRPEEKTT